MHHPTIKNDKEPYSHRNVISPHWKPRRHPPWRWRNLWIVCISAKRVADFLRCFFLRGKKKVAIRSIRQISPLALPFFLTGGKMYYIIRIYKMRKSSSTSSLCTLSASFFYRLRSVSFSWKGNWSEELLAFNQKDIAQFFGEAPVFLFFSSRIVRSFFGWKKHVPVSIISESIIEFY